LAATAAHIKIDVAIPPAGAIKTNLPNKALETAPVSVTDFPHFVRFTSDGREVDGD
jgi:hypothetical protein